MELRPFGPTGIKVPAVGLGTWEMERDPTASIAAIRRALDLGMTHLDTAEMYGAGEVERIVGRAIAGRRDEIFLVSKVLPQNASFEGTLRACERSLERLGTDRLDGYLLHWRGSHPLEETFRAFETLRAQGKIRHSGVSNFDVADLEEAGRIAGPGRIACNQVLYHLEERHVEHALLGACAERDVALVAYSPLGSGAFPAPRSERGRALADLARALGATPRQLALRFLLRHPGVLVIPKSARVSHVEELAAAGGMPPLGAETVAALDRVFPPGARGRELPMV